MHTALLLLLALGGCKKDPGTDSTPKTEPAACDTVTDTVPAFCNEVPSNLVFLSIDTFRRDLLSRYGGDPDIVPTLNRLAEEGYTLDNNVQCANWTFASTTCTLLGQTNVNAGWMPRLSGAEPVPAGFRMLPGYLADDGVWSVLVSSNGWLSNTWGNGRDYNQVIYPGGGHITGVADNGISALRFAQDLGIADRWFMHLHALEPHVPYIPPDPYLTDLSTLDPVPWDLTEQTAHYASVGLWPVLTPEQQDLLMAHMQVRYHGEARWMDDGIAEVLERMDQEGLLDDTLLVIWTDHGEQFFEHGHQSHAHDLFAEENDTLAIFWARNIVPGVHTLPTQSTDILPTLFELWGKEIPPGLDGIPLSQGTDDRVRFTSADARQGTMQAVIADGWKLTFYWSGGQLVLTHPAEDPAETPLDLAANAAKVNELWTLLEPRAQQVVAIKGTQPLVWPTLP